MTPVSGVQRLYQGAELTGYITLGDLVIEPYYNLTGAQADSNELSSSINPWSITIPGQQLPNVPLQKAGIVLDYKAPHSMFEWLADAQHVGTNNPNNLPPYTTFDAGVTAQLTRGTLTFAATNITNAFGGIFASPVNAVPFTTAGRLRASEHRAAAGAAHVFGNLFGALRPGRAQSQTAIAFHAARRRAAVAAAPLVVRRCARRRPGAAVAAVEAVAAWDRSSRRCRKRRPPIRSSSAPIRQRAAPRMPRRRDSFRASSKPTSRRSKRHARRPAIRPRCRRPSLTDATITYHGLGTTYALAITPKGTGMLRALAGCMPLHIARADDVAQRKLFAPSSPLFFVPQLTFMPAVGLYFVARQPQAGQEMFRVLQAAGDAHRRIRLACEHRRRAPGRCRTSRPNRSTS